MLDKAKLCHFQVASSSPIITGQLWNKTSHFTTFFDIKANTILFLTGAPKEQILLPMTGKPMEQASISGFQNLKVKKMLKTWKPMEQASISGFQNLKINLFLKTWKPFEQVSTLGFQNLKDNQNVENLKTNGAGFNFKFSKFKSKPFLNWKTNAAAGFDLGSSK